MLRLRPTRHASRRSRRAARRSRAKWGGPGCARTGTTRLVRRTGSLSAALVALLWLCGAAAPLRAEQAAKEPGEAGVDTAGASAEQADLAEAPAAEGEETAAGEEATAKAEGAGAKQQPTALPPAPPPGAEALAHELSLRLLTLQQREETVELRERSIVEIESESQRILDEVGSLRAAIEARIAEHAKGDVERIARLAKVYSAMPPASAAKLLEALPLDVSARVLAKMKQKNAAQILTVIASPAAVRISKNVLDPLQLGPQPAAPKELP